MKNDKIILVSVIAWSVMSVVLATPAAATQNALYFVPDSGSLPGYCESIDIDLMADINEANPVIAASVNITFDPNCVEITNWAADTTVWTGGATSTATWSLPHGFLTITTVRMEGISGSLGIGTLTLHCNSTEDCETCLKFSTGEYTTASPVTIIIAATDNGTFLCGEGEQEGGGNSGGEITITSSPTPTPTVTPMTTPNPAPTSASEEKKKFASPGFGLIISVGMLVAAVYLIRKRGAR